MTSWSLRWLIAALASYTGACSLTLDTDKKACTSNAGCGAPYVCKQSLCVVQTGCAQDADCRKLEPVDLYKNTICDAKTHECLAAECTKTDDCEALFCDTTENRCVAQNKTTCSKDADCAHYDGLPICTGGRCGEAECRTKDDCQGDTATVTCSGGKCVDPVWGCIGQPDERPAPMSQTATYRIQALGVLTKAAVPDLKIKGCAQLDQHCDAALPLDIDYDLKTGWITVKGLSQDAPIHLNFQSADYIETDYYDQQPARDITEAQYPANLIPPNLVAAIGSSVGIDVDVVNKGTVISRLFDCSVPPKGGAGLTLSVSEMTDATEVFYVDEGDIPLPDAQQTSSYGAAGVANMKPDRQVTLTVRLGDMLVTTFAVTPYAGRVTFVWLHPRDYAAK